MQKMLVCIRHIAVNEDEGLQSFLNPAGHVLQFGCITVPTVWFDSPVNAVADFSCLLMLTIA